MLTQVYPNIYKNEIPLPNNPLKAINSYIVLSENRNLIIDTGFNRAECRNALFQGIRELDVDLTKTDLVLTHMHVDHSGLAAALAKEGVRVYIGKIDGEWLNQTSSGKFIKNFQMLNEILGFGGDRTINFGKDFGTRSEDPLELIPLLEGDKFELGDYSFEIIDIPGHTPGHIGLYERNHRLFFGGDHILDPITPNITFWGFEQDILAIFFKSLRKVYAYNIDYLFTAHRNIIRDHKTRIKELLAHHEDRLKEISGIIRKGKKTPSETAAAMHWDLSYTHWEDFPDPQKWFASGEATSHLEHLVHLKLADRVNNNGKLYYELRS
ncbi:MBL fold metallo-hydrolase [Desulfitobacterium sp.]|uniref:MBL fold metallo-hydrolase n=1 Tax=Desulfitobacterium sp. TaxID=49981 RepID=UPI002CF363DE|nr:MBL fold metallo-hydrolase [Desulfitobacterium sp.]HVJ49524.1 MBL fold metallo-hydrolase [Desulfitobacterium sp.]